MEAHNKTVQTMITSSSRPLYRALCTLLLCIAVLWAMPKSARAQLLVSEYSSDSVGEFNATTGALINPSFITGLNGPSAIALSDNSLFVANYDDAFGENAGTTVGKYNATTGAAINPSFITGLNDPWGLALSGNNLFVSEGGRASEIGLYNATTGATINDDFITMLNFPRALAVSGNNLFVANFLGNSVGEYNATTGDPI